MNTTGAQAPSSKWQGAARRTADSGTQTGTCAGVSIKWLRAKNLLPLGNIHVQKGRKALSSPHRAQAVRIRRLVLAKWLWQVGLR